MTTHYETLEVLPTASPEVIAVAFESLVQRLSPGNGSEPGPQTAARIAAVHIAYRVLSNAQMRDAYDSILAKEKNLLSQNNHRRYQRHPAFEINPRVNDPEAYKQVGSGLTRKTESQHANVNPANAEKGVGKSSNHR